MNPRQLTEQTEHTVLCEYAAFADSSRGREKSEPPCELRTEFARDRDRIIHCKAFRRLKQKTQVFLAPEGDHYRTRLTHTLEVSQIARTLARLLRLNEDLTEAIALGHDLGHTPFGHAGERALNALCADIGGFAHYTQSLRVVSVLEKDCRGLNLTRETNNGIVCHTTGTQAFICEGQIVRLADKIAYLNHDFEDATVSAGFALKLPAVVTDVLGCTKSQRITSLIKSAMLSPLPEIKLEPDVQTAFDAFYKYMMENLYLSSRAKDEEHKVHGLISGMFNYFCENPHALPKFYAEIAEKEGPMRAATDYISGMSDAFAVAEYERIFVPKGWARQL